MAVWFSEAETQPPTAFNPNGYTAPALQAAWALITQTSFPDDAPERGRTPASTSRTPSRHAAVRIGNDTDTVAAIAGGLLGAYWGQSAIPLSWVRRVHGWTSLRARRRVRWPGSPIEGASDSMGWPAIELFEYADPEGPAVPHTRWTTASTSAPKTPQATTPLPSCPCFAAAPPTFPTAQWLPATTSRYGCSTTTTRREPNLALTLADTGAAIAELREEGHRVLVHCVRAERRTPSVAVAYAVLLGATRTRAGR